MYQKCFTVPEIWHNKCNYYFLFWTIFCPFTTLTAKKMKISKKWKRTLEISSFNTSVPKIWIVCFTVPEIWHMTDVIVIFRFGLFLPFYHPNSLKNKNFKKNEKEPWKYHHLTQVYQKSWSYAVVFLRYGMWQM